MSTVAESAVSVPLESLPCGAFVTRRDGYIVAANAFAHRIFGYEADTLPGRSIETLLPESARARHVGHRRRFERESGSRPMRAGTVVQGRHNDGRALALEVSLVRTGDQIIAMVLDVTRRERLLASEEAHSRHDEGVVAEVVGGLAHQFNNQLAAIVSSLHLARDSDPDAQSRDLLDGALRAAGRARELVAQITGQDGASGESAPSCSPAEELRNREFRLRALLPSDSGFELTVEGDVGRVALAADELYELVASLVRNAGDALGRDGRVTVAVRDLADHVLVEVVDNGHGIEPSLLPHITKPFVTTRPYRPGAGLGLTSVHGMAERAGGGVSVCCPPEGGTQVSVTLARVHERSAARAASKGRILVVDDERIIREVVAAGLERRGHTVTVASSGEEALQHLATTRFDILLTDVVMPGMDGLTLAQAALAHQPDVRVLFMSGYSRDVLAEQGVEAGGDFELLPKPFSAHALASRVAGLLAQVGAPAH